MDLSGLLLLLNGLPEDLPSTPCCSQSKILNLTIASDVFYYTTPLLTRIQSFIKVFFFFTEQIPSCIHDTRRQAKLRSSLYLGSPEHHAPRGLHQVCPGAQESNKQTLFELETSNKAGDNDENDTKMCPEVVVHIPRGGGSLTVTNS